MHRAFPIRALSADLAGGTFANNSGDSAELLNSAREGHGSSADRSSGSNSARLSTHGDGVGSGALGGSPHGGGFPFLRSRVKLGNGGSGAVWLGRDRRNGALVAVKRIFMKPTAPQHALGGLRSLDSSDDSNIGVANPSQRLGTHNHGSGGSLAGSPMAASNAVPRAVLAGHNLNNSNNTSVMSSSSNNNSAHTNALAGPDPAEHEVLEAVGCHPSIVRLLGWCESSDGYRHVALELFDSDLSNELRQGACYTEADARRILGSLLSAVAHTHAAGIAHRDIKPSNVLLARDGPRVALADFGVAHAASALAAKGASHFNHRGTRAYQPPEVLLARVRVETVLAGDVWACGCVFYELMARAPLFPGGPAMEMLAAIFARCGTSFNDSRTARREGTLAKDVAQLPLSAAGKALLLRMLDPDETARIGAAEALRHPFFGGCDDSQGPANEFVLTQQYTLEGFDVAGEEQQGTVPTQPAPFLPASQGDPDSPFVVRGYKPIDVTNVDFCEVAGATRGVGADAGARHDWSVGSSVHLSCQRALPPFGAGGGFGGGGCDGAALGRPGGLFGHGFGGSVGGEGHSSGGVTAAGTSGGTAHRATLSNLRTSALFSDATTGPRHTGGPDRSAGRHVPLQSHHGNAYNNINAANNTAAGGGGGGGCVNTNNNNGSGNGTWCTPRRTYGQRLCFDSPQPAPMPTTGSSNGGMCGGAVPSLPPSVFYAPAVLPHAGQHPAVVPPLPLGALSAATRRLDEGFLA